LQRCCWTVRATAPGQIPERTTIYVRLHKIRLVAGVVPRGYHSGVFRSVTGAASKMIEVVPQLPDGRGVQLRLRPPQALDAHQFKQLFVACLALMWGAGAMGWWAGNVFAPLFAVLHSALVGLALRAVWKSGRRDEVIAIDPELVEVRRSTQPVPAFRAHPYWVRLGVGRDGERVTLSSSGRHVEVGALLGPAERQQLAIQLRALLAAALRP
jgi:uncharacterized membrane protein